ncbi:very short patch repair endonuclease [Allopontixanthobacter sp.]|uniref:very short patch repair endonuclease n=1 Tax=Allopontixanthobacter sp. TaxID=2906452 RepID=UPI002ABC1F98|nr:very short patch repair endonuclease [Allopontixanthobacter sp.]MDZ4308203.1 very short patch repair endonuclease [Allopontixanthobacter sp.]
MVDVVTPEVRSRMMAGIRAKNTKPEMVVRQGLHRLGFRFRLHDKKLPGKPDLVFPKFGSAIFVNGCFWHAHDCHMFKLPKSRTDFWCKKFTENQKRDQRVRRQLDQMGIRHLTIWECDLMNKSSAKIFLLLDECAAWLRRDEDGMGR